MKLVLVFLLITYNGLGKCKFATYTVKNMVKLFLPYYNLPTILQACRIYLCMYI